jgi:hypothetical protein
MGVEYSVQDLCIPAVPPLHFYLREMLYFLGCALKHIWLLGLHQLVIDQVHMCVGTTSGTVLIQTEPPWRIGLLVAVAMSNMVS